ncbi:MAG: phosphate-starvation-inducible PsiE family protein [Actinomycetota bacterium]|nr:phosphate-starvation-inducible PsiE family protein [Actinomycetota bacterium]
MSQGTGGGRKGIATRKARSNVADAFRYIEQIFYILVAAALAAAGAGLFVYVVYSFFTSLGDSSFLTITLELLDGLLLVFITTELLHTVRAVIDESVLMTEPFLIVGIVAVIRRLILISAEAKELVGTPTFGDLMLEMGILTGVVVALGLTIFMLRHTQRTEPRPYDPDVDESDIA